MWGKRRPKMSRIGMLDELIETIEKRNGGAKIGRGGKFGHMDLLYGSFN